MTFFDPNNAEWFNGLLWQNNAEMYRYSDDKWHVTVESDQSKQVAEYWQKLIDDKLVRTDLANGSTQMYAAYQKNQIASYVGAAWGYSMFRDNLPDQAGKWSIVPMPTWGTSAASGDWGGSTVAFMKGSKHLYESVKFNTWLNTDPEALALENKLGGLYPAATDGAGAARALPGRAVLQQREDLRRLRRVVQEHRHRASPGVPPRRR